MLALVTSTLAFTSQAPLASWETHGEEMREEVLNTAVQNDWMIDAINLDPSSTWKAGRNERFEGATLKQAKVLMGTLQASPADILPAKAPDNLPMALPDNFDWRTDPRAAKCPSLKEVRDQANCGSCWAFGSVEAMTDRVCLASKGEKQVHLSAQDVASCDKLGDMGCNGGVPSTVYSYYKNAGIVSGGNYGDESMCYSYQLAPCAHHTNSTKYAPCDGDHETPSCARKCVDNKQLTWASDKHHSEAGYSVCQQGMSNGACADAMAQEIYKNGPITGMFFVRQSFTLYKSGVYQVTHPFKDPMLGGHAIKIMGFGVENGVKY